MFIVIILQNLDYELVMYVRVQFFVGFFVGLG